MKDVTPTERLHRMLADRQEGFDLAEAALLVAEKEYPGLDIRQYLRRLDDLAECARASLPPDGGTHDAVTALNRILFEVEGFCGNSQDYYDPRNSYLHEVLDRRRGIPITLSIVYLAVGRRLGLSVDGVSFPGHFLVKLASGDGVIVLDPFARGKVVSDAELHLRLQNLYGDEAPPFTADLLASAGKKEILARMLRNLKGIFLHRKDFTRALYAVNCILIAAPESADDLRDRGRIYERLECYRAAVEDYRRYLVLDPGATDARDIRARLPPLEQAAARLN